MISLSDDKQAVILTLLALHTDNWMIFQTLRMFILTIW